MRLRSLAWVWCLVSFPTYISLDEAAVGEKGTQRINPLFHISFLFGLYWLVF